MDHLPAETLQHVARYLHDTHRPSLVSLSCVSKTCYAAAKVWLFRRIRLQVTVTDPAQLQQEAVDWADLLRRTQSQDHVRQVAIVPQGSHRDRKELDNENDTWLDEVYGEDQGTEADLRYDRDEPFPPVGEEENKAWLPVAGLISLLSHIGDLVYTPNYMLPPCLLRALHKHHPQCRLHIYRFRFKSLHEPTVDPQELDIATSPCLHSITVRHVFRDSGDRDDWNIEAYHRLVTRMAPNLKKIRTLFCSNRYPLRSSSVAPRKPWLGVFQDEGVPSPGSLESLSLHGMPFLNQPFMDRLAGSIDFSHLRVLDVRFASGPMLSWALENVTLPNLKKLRLHLRGSETAISSCLAFFSRIPPLELLDYSGEPDEVFDCILHKHGPSLLSLSLDLGSELDFPAVRKLQRECPRLESLRISIKRSLSDETEVSVYRALGKMRHLTELSLTLDCTDHDAPRQTVLSQPPYNDFDDPFDRITWQTNPLVKFGHVRIALLNSALDEALARSIWEVINESKEKRPLQSLKLQPSGGNSFGRLAGDMCEVIRCLSRSYSLERSLRDDEVGVRIRELDKRAREAKCSRHALEKPGDEPAGKVAMRVFRQIWPKKEGSASWHNDWSSLPLRK